MKETELYESVRRYFIGLGFTVRAEVRDIDICAVRDDLLVGIELKRNFSTDLLIQAVQRQKVCDLVYIAVPKPKRVKKDRSFRNMLHMLSRLELGLLYVDIVTGHVTEVLEPTFYDLDKARRTMMKARRTILSEIKRRTLDGNVGGSNKKRLLTAYREESLKAVALIRHHGVISPKDLKGIGIRPGLLNNNFYGWFEKVERGRYVLSEKKASDYVEYEAYIALFQRGFEAEAEEKLFLLEAVTFEETASDDAVPTLKGEESKGTPKEKRKRKSPPKGPAVKAAKKVKEPVQETKKAATSRKRKASEEKGVPEKPVRADEDFEAGEPDDRAEGGKPRKSPRKKSMEGETGQDI